MRETPKTVGAFEAKTRLSEILEDVRRGSRVAVTKRGRPIAMIVPIEPESSPSMADVLAGLDAIRGAVKGQGAIRSLVRAGRRR